jgi:hypothetical protein
LRIQTNPENKAEFESISNERYVILPFSISLKLSMKVFQLFKDIIY